MNTIETLFVPYELAVKLKELGFDEPCFAFYLAGGIRFKQYKDSKNRNSAFFNKTVCSIPTFSQAFRWFREKYSDLDFGVSKIHNGTNNYHYHINLTWEFFEGTYEEAELACLTKLIEIVQGGNNE